MGGKKKGYLAISKEGGNKINNNNNKKWKWVELFPLKRGDFFFRNLKRIVTNSGKVGSYKIVWIYRLCYFFFRFFFPFISFN